MKAIRHILGILMMLIGVISVNAIPYVPHHHHDGKICVEQTQEADDCTESHDGKNDAHSEEGEYDIPQDTVRFEFALNYSSALLSLLADFNVCGNILDVKGVGPEKYEIFSEEDFSAISQALRGSPFFS